jgi:peptide chain release factor subunit 1
MNREQREWLQKLIAHLSGRKAEAGLLLTLYVPPEDIDRARQFVKAERAQAGNIRDRVTRKMVSDALYDATRALLYNVGPQGRANGVAVFADGKGVPYMVSPPEPILGFVYKCERSYFLDPLADMLAATSVWGLVVVDRQEATVGWTDGRRVELLLNTESFVQGKTHMGGMSQHRYQENGKLQLKTFFRKVGDSASQIFLKMGPRLKGIYVGGPGFTKDEWLKDADLDYRVVSLLRMPTYHTGYTDEQGLRELAAQLPKERP